MIEDMAGWIAPIATMIAAVMTASNLGARVTGWGFVIFTIGSVGWSVVGLSSGQTNLVATNGFLTLVNIVGIWRWLGRQARYEEDSKAAVEASEAAPVPALVAASRIVGMTVVDRDGATVGSAMEAMIEDGRSGRIVYVVVRSGGVGGVGERLAAVDRDAMTLANDRLTLAMTRQDFDALPEWDPEKPLRR